MKAQCTTNKQGREYEWAPFHEALEEQRALTRSERGRAALRMRKQTVEPVFGQIKEGGRFRRFTVYGLEAVQAQWTLVCAAFNLKKLYALWCRGVLCLFGPPPVTPAPAAALAVLVQAARGLAPRPLQRLTTLGCPPPSRSKRPAGPRWPLALRRPLRRSTRRIKPFETACQAQRGTSRA